MSIRLYLDDVRNPPDDGGGPWTICRTLGEAKVLLLRGVDEASLDHDLGQCDACRSNLGPNNCAHVGTGYDLVKWMAEHGVWPTTKPRVHSMNIVGKQAMRQMIERHWRSPTHAQVALFAFAAELLAAAEQSASYAEAIGDDWLEETTFLRGQAYAYKVAAKQAMVSAKEST